ncbi:MAG: DsbA family protein [Pseudomonadota bacterium]
MTAIELSKPSVDLDDSPTLGSDTAKIGIVEFSDYECPYCRTSQTQLLPQIKKEYIDTGVVRYVHKDYPLVSIHAQAAPAAIAAQCAHAQGRFWDMHQALFANLLRDALYPELARRLKLNEQKFSACLNDAAPRQAIYRDVQEARRLGISGTPSFVVGRIEGNKLIATGISKGMPSIEAIVQQVEVLRK